MSAGCDGTNLPGPRQKGPGDGDADVSSASWCDEQTRLDAHVAWIKPTTGLCPHAIWCPSTPPFLLSRTVSFPLSSMFEWSSPFGGCPSPPSVTNPHSAIPQGILSLPLWNHSWLHKKKKQLDFPGYFPLCLYFYFEEKKLQKISMKGKIYIHEKSARKKGKSLVWRADVGNWRVKEQRYSLQCNSLSQFESTVGGPKHENESVG